MIQRPPLEVDATPIGRDWVEYADSLRDQLEQAQARERGLREALELIAWSKPPIRETEGEWRLKAQVVAREALAAQSKESEDSRA